MTSMLRSLIRTSSTYTKPDASNDPGSMAPTTPTTPGSPTSTLTNSPSFNDFSLGLSQQDADLASSMPVTGRPRGFSMDIPGTPPLNRESMDSQRASLDIMSRTPSVLAAWGAGTIFSPSPAINIPAGNPALKPNAPPNSRNKPNKLDGLDYYQWCELVRSSSF